MAITMKRFLIGTLSVAMLLAVSLANARAEDKEEVKPAEDTTQAAEEPKEEAPKDEEPKAEETPDPYEVPEGTADELLNFMDELTKYRPRITSRQEYYAAQKKTAEAMAEATDRILDLEEKIEEAIAEKVIQTRASALSTLANLGDEEAAKNLAALPELLEKLGYESFVRPVEAKLLGSKFNTLRTAENPDKAIQPLIEEVVTFIKEAGKDLTMDDLRLAYSAVQTANGISRVVDNPDIAINAYKTFGELLINSGNEDADGLGKKFLGAVRRLKLPGNSIEIKGFTLSGDEFNIDSLKGKTVLIDFWATWCGPCLGEIPNMLEMYEAYKDKGFEIVGISVDSDIERLKGFIEKREIPWIILQDTQTEKPDYEENSDRYGISGIPSMILVGADGKVISISARGHALNAELEKIYGPIEKEPVEDGEETETQPEA